MIIRIDLIILAILSFEIIRNSRKHGLKIFLSSNESLSDLPKKYYENFQLKTEILEVNIVLTIN